MTKEEFISKYNQCIKWNTDILKEIGLDKPIENDYAKDVTDLVFDFRPITGEEFDMDTAEITSEDEEYIELRIYGRGGDGYAYFTLFPIDSDEQAYKASKLQELSNAVDNMGANIKKKDEELEQMKDGYYKLCHIISQLNKPNEYGEQ